MLRKPLFIWSLLTIPLFFLCVLLLMETAGARGRKFHPVMDSGVIEIRVIRTNVELYNYWKSLGLNGRIVLHAGRYLHYVADDETAMGYKATPTYPVIIQPTKVELEKRVNYTNVLWVAVQTNIARALYMLMTTDDFNARFSSEADFPEHRKGGAFKDHDFGAPRVILDTIPPVKEQVVLNMDASYFSGVFGENLLNKIQEGALRADVITLCLSEDNPDVREHERLQAMKVLERVATASNGKIKLRNYPKGISE